MSTFRLEVLTPEKKFFEGDVNMIVVRSTDGDIGILPGHTPLIAPIGIGSLRILVDGKWRDAFISGGFMEVKPTSTLILSDAVEWPEEIDIKRAEAAKERALERLRQKKSREEYIRSQVALLRALNRIKIARKYKE